MLHSCNHREYINITKTEFKVETFVDCTKQGNAMQRKVSQSKKTKANKTKKNQLDLNFIH